MAVLPRRATSQPPPGDIYEFPPMCRSAASTAGHPSEPPELGRVELRPQGGTGGPGAGRHRPMLSAPLGGANAARHGASIAMPPCDAPPRRLCAQRGRRPRRPLRALAHHRGRGAVQRGGQGCDAAEPQPQEMRNSGKKTRGARTLGVPGAPAMKAYNPSDGVQRPYSAPQRPCSVPRPYGISGRPTASGTPTAPGASMASGARTASGASAASGALAATGAPTDIALAAFGPRFGRHGGELDHFPADTGAHACGGCERRSAGGETSTEVVRSARVQ